MNRFVLGFMALCISFAMWPAGLASAHADLESSIPAPSAVLEVAPNEIVLDFSEPVSSVERSVELFDEDRKPVDLPQVISPESDRLEVRNMPNLGDGLYLVVWRALSQDGHIARGAFTFQIGVGSPTVTAGELLADAQPTTMSAGIGGLRHGARIATYLGLAAALGTLALAASSSPRRIWRIIGIGWTMATIGTVLNFVTQGAYISAGGWTELVDVSAWSDVAATRLGKGLLARLVFLAVLLGLVILAHRGSRVSAADSPEVLPNTMAKTWWRSSAALIGSGIVLTLAATGHPSASSPAGPAVAVDSLHLGAILVWIGGLFAILSGRGDPEFVRKYSRVATFALPIAVVTGVWQAWHLLDNADDITSNSWGRALVVKMAIVVFVSALALVARWVVQSTDTAPLRRLVAVELVSVVGIIVATSFLVTSPPRVTAVPAVVSASLAQDDIIANVTITPGKVGPNELHVTIVTPGGTLDPVDGLEIRMTRNGSDIPPVTVDVEQLGPNHFLGFAAILQSGNWNFEFLVRVSEARIVRLSTNAEI